jgi:sulfite exporter TauE/SafE
MQAEFGYLLAFITGLTGAFHCLGMCGGIAGSYFCAHGWQRQITPHLLYHLTRISVYVVLGLLGAIIGRVLVQSGSFGKFQGVLMIATGTLIILMGFWLSGIFSRRKQTATPQKCSLPVRFGEQKQKKKLFPLIAGLLNGLVPCSLVFSVALKALATADPVEAGLLMLCFGLGTLPMMASVGAMGALIGQQRLAWLAKLSALAVIALGAWTLYEGWIFYDIMRGLAG